MKRLVIVGNAPPCRNISAFIDGCDFIVRMNNARNFSTGKVGIKTDALALRCSAGNMKKRILNTNSLVFASAIELWPESMNSVFVSYVEKFSAHAKVVRQLQKVFAWPQGSKPDIGIITIENVMRMSEFGCYRIFACLLPIDSNIICEDKIASHSTAHDFEETSRRIMMHIESGSLTYIK